MKWMMRMGTRKLCGEGFHSQEEEPRRHSPVPRQGLEITRQEGHKGRQSL